MPFGVDAWRLAVLPVVAALPWRCSLAPPAPHDDPPAPSAPSTSYMPSAPSAPSTSYMPSAPSAVEAKQEAAPPRVATPAAARSRGIALPDEVVLRAAGAGQAAFLGCWARAQRLDPLVTPGKVRLHLEIDEAGRVTAVASDTESAALARCLAVVARRLPFPAPGQPAVVDLPVIFQ